MHVLLAHLQKASSVVLEIVTPLRASMDPQKMDMLTFLAKNQKYH